MTDVLILEDELTSLQALSEILTTYSDDIRVHKASSLKEAKDLLDQEIRYGLFLLDVNLSGEDREDIGGILFAREIRERFEYTFTPIVMVTAIGNMEMQAYRELHCYQYIMKPFHREQVEEVVQKVLEKESREKPPVIVVIWGIVDWRSNYVLIRQKENELRLYQNYLIPLEELVKEIRAKQHEFDNHLNAILNMHLTIDNYEELVAKQSEYITEIAREDDSRKYLPLLKISDKILAGFIYSKIVRAPEYVRTDIRVWNKEIVSGISEHHLIEIVGTLIDNAYEACTEEKNQVLIEIDSQNDKLIFTIKNQVENIGLGEISHFFEKGFSTKEDGKKHGLGLYNAKMLVNRYHGEITVEIEERKYISFVVVI